MIKLTRIVDAGILVMTELARRETCVSASELAESSGVSAPFVAKVLKRLARAGLVTSERGVRGGYRLAQPATEVSLGAIVAVLDGPISLTLCSSTATRAGCRSETRCAARGSLQELNSVVRNAFETVSLADLAGPPPEPRPAFTTSLPALAETRV